MRFVDKLAFANRLVWPFAVLGKLAFNVLEKLGRLHFFLVRWICKKSFLFSLGVGIPISLRLLGVCFCVL